jgi:hypothetical protein
MKKMRIFFSILTMALLSCNKGDEPGDDNLDVYKDAPRSELPAEISPAEWRYGSVSALSYYDERANFVAHSEEALREFKVTRDGFVEFVYFFKGHHEVGSTKQAYLDAGRRRILQEISL